MVFSLGPTEKTLWNRVDDYSQGHRDTGSQNEFYVAMSHKNYLTEAMHEPNGKFIKTTYRNQK